MAIRVPSLQPEAKREGIANRDLLATLAACEGLHEVQTHGLARDPLGIEGREKIVRGKGVPKLRRQELDSPASRGHGNGPIYQAFDGASRSKAF